VVGIAVIDNRVEGLTGQLIRFGKTDPLADVPRQCVADNEQDALIQLAAVLAVGCEVLWPDSALQRDLTDRQHSRQLDQRILLIIRHAQHALAGHQRQGVALAAAENAAGKTTAGAAAVGGGPT
jgi:delta 1-pyrroline-5-carboxylate dehydrogenase